MKKTIILLTISVTMLFIMAKFTLANEVQPYMKIGGEELVENGISEGHKAVTIIGINVINDELTKLEKTYSLEGWSMIEAVDEDPEMLKWGFKAGAELKYTFDKFPIHPYAGINFENWNREQNEKYIDSFKHLYFVDTAFGLATEYKFLYAKVGGIYPIWAEADNSNPSGELGFSTEVGMKWKKISVGYSYQHISFSGDGPQHDIESNVSCVKLSYSF